jgi:hypothetical protein
MSWRRRYNRGFKSASAVTRNPTLDIERHTRQTTGEMLRTERVIPKMIDRIKALFQDVSPIEVNGEEDNEEEPFEPWDEE